MTTEPKSILIADDQVLIALELERILKETLNCSVSVCSMHALEKTLATEAFDIVFVDAGPDPKDFARKYEEISRRGAKVAFLTSYPHMTTALAKFAALGVIEKPFDEYGIRDALENWLP